MPPSVIRNDRVLVAAAAIAGMGGIGVSVYLTAVHYSAVSLVCATTGVINCENVLASPYAVIAGSSVPTSAAGILWFSVSAALAVVQLRGHRAPPIITLHLVWSAIGLVTVLYLVFIEIVKVGAICLWCSSAHALVLLTFMIALLRATPTRVGGRDLGQ